MEFWELFSEKNIITSLRALEKDKVLKEMLEVMAGQKLFPKKHVDSVFRSLVDREKMGSTGIGRGVAIPHVKDPSIKEVCVGLGISQSGVDFNAIDGEPVYTIFLILSPEDKSEAHLKILRWISTLARNKDFCRFIRNTKDANDVISLIKEMGTGAP